MVVVNFWGHSCVGKSTHSAGLYSALKKAGVRVELAREHCKNWFYEGTQWKLNNQFSITGGMIEQIETFKFGGIDVVITDSPILLGALYSQVYNTDLYLAQAIRNKHNSYNNYNILLRPDIDFDPQGRGASGITRETIAELLSNENLNYDKEFYTTKLKSYAKIVSDIKRRIDE